MKQSFDDMKARIESSDENKLELDAQAKITKKHFASLQDLLKLAQEQGKLTEEEVATVRQQIGPSSVVCNEQPIWVRLVALNLYNELLHMRHRAVTDQV